jgi:alpha-beta hydrolase superfamily lysophospholipase
MQHISHKLVYYLPGWGGRLHTGLGEGLAERGFDIAGRETRDEFKDLTFQQKIDTIASDLQTHFWSVDAHVVANSFGGYLFLHAQAQMEPFPGKVLLLSPIVGDFRDERTEVGFVPPRPTFLMECALQGKFPTLRQAEIHVGSEDWQSHPENVQAFGDATGMPVTVVSGGGHMLGKEYVGGVLDRWFERSIP